MTECDCCNRRKHALGMRMCRQCWSKIGIMVTALGLRTTNREVQQHTKWYYDSMEVGPGQNYYQILSGYSPNYKYPTS